MDCLEQMERELSLPVVASNPAMNWYMLSKLGLKHPLPGFGRLLASWPNLPTVDANDDCRGSMIEQRQRFAIYPPMKKGGQRAMNQLAALFSCALILVIAIDSASAQSDFYRGKTMTFIVNMAAGDANDLWARALARSLVKYIPGNPNILAQNMAGGGSMISANYLYSVAKPDGLTIGQTSASLYFQQLTGRREVQFDWRKFSWIGSAGQVESLLMMRTDAPYKSMEDIRSASEPPKCSATAPGSGTHISLKVLDEALGAKFRIVTGYKSGSDQDLAIERGEVQCRAVIRGIFPRPRAVPQLAKKGFIRILVQSGAQA